MYPKVLELTAVDQILHGITARARPKRTQISNRLRCSAWQDPRRLISSSVRDSHGTSQIIFVSSHLFSSPSSYRGRSV